MRTSLVSLAAVTGLILLIAGCGGDSTQSAVSSSAADGVDACTLLTAGEIEAVTGVTPSASERPNPGLNNCQWPSAGEIVPIVYVGLSYKAANSWEEYREDMIANDYGDPEESGERVDIEVFGYYIPDSSMIQVQTHEGSLITLRVRNGDKAQIVDLANKAADRLM